MKGICRWSKQRLSQSFSGTSKSFIQKPKFDLVDFLLLFVFYSFFDVFLMLELFIDVQRIIQTIRGITSILKVSAVRRN